MRVLICQLKSHGDIIRAFPLIESLKTFYEDLHIGFTCLPEMTETCALCEDIDEIIPQEKMARPPGRLVDCLPLACAVNAVKDSHYDVYIDLHGIFQSACFGSLAEIPVRLGRSHETCKDGAHMFYNAIADVPDWETNRMERHFTVARALFPLINPLFRQSVNNDSRTIAIFPGSSRLGILKRWQTENYVSIAEHFVQMYKVNIVLGPEEKDLASEFKHIEPVVKTAVLSDWHSVLRLIRGCRFVIGNDSAAAHIAVWQGVPSFTVFGPTSHVINGVWQYGIGADFTGVVKCDCHDVWSGKCDNKRMCFSGLHASDVWKAIEKKMSEASL